MIEINKLRKLYGKAAAVDIDQLTIAKGESFGLVGNNGAGKTTLFKLILDLNKASDGEVLIKSTTVALTDEWKAFTGSFLDESFLIEFLTPEEYFNFIAQLQQVNDQALAGFLGLFEEFFNDEILGKRKYIRDMSKGNQKKIGIVGAMLGAPEILILDEPFANLDPSSQIKLKELLINDQKSNGTTMLISSHDLSHVTDVCERIVVLEKGKVVKDIFSSEGALEKLESYFA